MLERVAHALLFMASMVPCGVASAQLLPADYSFPVVNDHVRPALLPFNGSMADPNFGTAQLPSHWRYEDLGLFCKLDVQFERHLRFPVLFRLGDVRQVEAWEGKGPEQVPMH